MNNKVVFRGADVGYTRTFDEGVLKGARDGFIAHFDAMFDAMNIRETLKTVRDEMPWISIGWHRHLWERPVAPIEKVPSMVDEEGRFKWRHRNQQLMAEVPYEEAMTEFEAEMALCYECLGRYPDTTSVRDNDTELERAFKDICNKYGIHMNVAQDSMFHTNNEYKQLNYYMRAINPLVDLPEEERKGKKPYDLSNIYDYDPAQKVIDTPLEDKNWLISCHPGYLDTYIWKESSCNLHRVRELEGYLDPRIGQWVLDNKIILCNERDIINGTSEYQDHLKEINSPYWIGNM